jgi:putative hemolysin
MEIIILLVLIVINGVFAMAEIALVSSRKSRLEQMAAKGSTGAMTALELLKDPEDFLSTVQIGITLIGIFAGAYGGTALADDLTPILARIVWLQPYAPQVAFGLIVTIITYLSLVVGELVPKSIAMTYAEGITIVMAPIMKVISKITYPFVVLLSLSTKLLLKVLFIKERGEDLVSEEELKYMIAQGSESGVLEQKESDIMSSVFSMADKSAYSVMIHRKDVVWLNAALPNEANIQMVLNSPFSKFPLCNGSIDNVIGTIAVKDILQWMITGSKAPLSDFATEPIFIHESTSALSIIDIFKARRSYVGYVTNEYGIVEGIVTLHDLIEHLVGDLPEIGEEAEIIEREDGSWLIDGSTKIQDVFELLGIFDMPGYDDEEYTTMGGFVMYYLKRIPKAGEHFTVKRYRFEIVDTDQARIDKVLVSREEEA